MTARDRSHGDRDSDSGTLWGTHVTRIQGRPGAGKTHHLLDVVEHHVAEDGLGLFDVLMANFTNNGREATADDLLAREIFDPRDYGDGVDEGTVRSRCKTLHSIALRCCPAVEDPHDQVITLDGDPGWWGDDEESAGPGAVHAAFCRERGLGFATEETNPLRMIQGGSDATPRGNKLFAVDRWLHAMYLPEVDRLARVVKCPVDLDLPPRRIRSLLQEWDDYKRAGGPIGGPRLFEHHDYVDHVLQTGRTPDADLLCIDEFQDLAPTEYALYELWQDNGTLDYIYAAGDTDQSLYGFRCATPLYLREMAVDEDVVLDESYRCPAAVTAAGSAILGSIPGRKAPTFRTAPRSGGHVPSGSAETVSVDGGDAEALADLVRDRLAEHGERRQGATATADGADPVVYLLTRTNWQLGVLAAALQREGVPFTALGDKMDPWPDYVVDCLLALRALRRGTPMVAEVAETLLDRATNPAQRRARFDAAEDAGDVHADTRDGGDSYVDAEQLAAAFPRIEDGPRGIASALDLPETHRDMIAGALGSDDAPHPGRVRVGTIHEAKGLQAPAVVLFSETSAGILDRYERGENVAEEHRVAYVGVTRASESLTLVDGFFPGPTLPLLADGLPGEDTADADGGEGSEVRA